MGDNPQVNKITKKIAASEMEKDPNNNQEGSNEHLEEGRRYWLLKKLQESAEKNMRLEKRVRQKLRTFVVIFVLYVAVAFAFIILQNRIKIVSSKFEYFIKIVGELGGISGIISSTSIFSLSGNLADYFNSKPSKKSYFDIEISAKDSLKIIISKFSMMVI